MQDNTQALSFSGESVLSAVVVTLARDRERQQRAITEISGHPSIRVGAVKDCWLPLAVEARSEQETQQIHHWITSREGVDVADVVAISCGCEVQSFEEATS